jgi:hypothetical protein
MSITTPTQDPTLQQYQRFWIVTASQTPRIHSRPELAWAITQFQLLLREGHSPRFLGEAADGLLHDLGLPQPAISPSDAEALRAAHQASCGQKYPIPEA